MIISIIQYYLCRKKSGANTWYGRFRITSKKGFDKDLVKYCEAFCNSRNIDLIWFKARTAAVGFYKKMNYEIFGAPFDIKDETTLFNV